MFEEIVYVFDLVENFGVLFVKCECGVFYVFGFVEGAEDVVVRLVDVFG